MRKVTVQEMFLGLKRFTDNLILILDGMQQTSKPSERSKTVFFFNSTALTPRGDQHANSNNQQIYNANIQMIYIEMYFGEMRELLITSEGLQSYYHTEIFKISKFY